MLSQPKTKVLIVDDSAMVRKVLSTGLGADPSIEIIGTAATAELAARMIRQRRPDVITLDLEMPHLDGLSFLKTYMSTDPIPTVVISSLTSKSTQLTMEALEAGAVEVISKPALTMGKGLSEIMQNVTISVKAAAKARLRPKKAPPVRPVVHAARNNDWVFAVGASTGGVQALANVLPQFDADMPAMVIVQHMPKGFTGSFAKRLDTQCKIEVREAQHGDELRPGLALLAPGGEQHMIIRRSRSGVYFVQLIDGPQVRYSRPSVDVLFQSVAWETKGRCSGALLTGMGKDGAQGMVDIRSAGGRTFAQDEESCVVFGMPLAAWEIGGAEALVPLEKIPDRMTASVGVPSAITTEKRF